MLLGQVRELKVEAEGSEDLGLPLERQLPYRSLEVGARAGPAGAAGLAGEGADPLLVGEQVVAFLLDEDAAEDLAEQPDVPPERCFGIARAQGRVTAPSLADETCAAYFASTPLS